MSKQAYKFKFYPTRMQQERLRWTLDHCHELYNAGLQERRNAYRMAGKSITYYDQANQLPGVKQVREEYQDIHSQVLQDVLRKADKRSLPGTSPAIVLGSHATKAEIGSQLHLSARWLLAHPR